MFLLSGTNAYIANIEGDASPCTHPCDTYKIYANGFERKCENTTKGFINMKISSLLIYS